MKKWEYDVIDVGNFKDDCSLVEALERLGNQGWRVVPAQFYFPCGRPEEVPEAAFILLEREKQAPKKKSPRK